MRYMAGEGRDNSALLKLKRESTRFSFRFRLFDSSSIRHPDEHRSPKKAGGRQQHTRGNNPYAWLAAHASHQVDFRQGKQLEEVSGNLRPAGALVRRHASPEGANPHKA